MASAWRPPCSRPAIAEGMRQRGSSALGPKAANELGSANTENVVPAKAAISAAGPAPNGDGLSTPEGTNTTASSQSWATLRLTELPTPPSMYRRPAIVTGGHAPGTAQLA